MKYAYATALLTVGMLIGLGTQYTTDDKVFAQESQPSVASVDMLWEIVDTYEAIGIAYNMTGVTEAAQEAKDNVFSLNKSDLVPVNNAIIRWNEATQNLASLLLSDDALAKVAVTKTAGFPDAPYSFCGTSRIDSGILLAALETFAAAEIARDIALRACQQVVVLLGEGGNTSSGCIATDAIFFVAKAVYDGIVFCEGDKDSAEIKGIYDRAGHIHGDVEILDGKLDAIDMKLDYIIELVLANAAAIEANRLAICDAKRLIVTPSGLRESNCETCSDQPGYPYSWPEGQGQGNGNAGQGGKPTTSSGNFFSRLFSKIF